MAVKQNVKHKRRGGRPATGHDPVTALRMPPALAARVEEWAKQQPDQPSRSEAIRRMIEMVLKMKEKRRKPQ
jgi:Arc/MetJ-type ribon-helix-helix transcriptional regulator